MNAQAESMNAGATGHVKPAIYLALLAVVAAVLTVIYLRTANELYINWTLTDSYYTHGFLVPFVSLYFIWRDRAAIRAIPLRPSAWGIVWMLFASFMLLLGDFLGFRVFAHISLVPMLVGLVIIFAGTEFAMRIWFALFFLLFMIPIPPSLTQSIALQLKLLAAECAVRVANLITLPMVREGSYIYFGNDRLLVGDVCGGLRSLIALLAIGAVAAYISPAKAWARALILILAGPIAIVSNIARIFFLCVVGYFYGSEVAGGWVHDYSGFLIYAIAIALFTAIDIPLRRWAPGETEPAEPQASVTGARTLRKGIIAVAMTILVVVAISHVQIVNAQSLAKMEVSAPVKLDIPADIADYSQAGDDYPIDDRTREVLETSAILIREYRAPGRRLLLSIVHAGSTRRSLHFPEVCLVGDGWEIVKQEHAPVGILFSAKRLVLVKGDSSEAVLYWFKTGDHVTGNYFDNALQWAKNQVTFGEPTSAMIKLTTPIGPSGERAAFATLEDFAAKFSSVMYRSIK
ncbi:MAG TPA: EpsI family protein [Candidatus Hydrogenedentes bacterium]|nr:EpsI family protein [Candidatus Hydrogenedentota bacterium]